MHLKISAPNEFAAGILYLLFSVGVFVLGRNYAVGSASEMGPGYIPHVLSIVLFLYGLVGLARSVVLKGHRPAGIALRPVLACLLSIVLFGLLIEGGGLVLACPVLILVAAIGSRQFRLAWRPLLGVVLLVMFCSVVFVQGLGMQVPIIGPWFVVSP